MPPFAQHGRNFAPTVLLCKAAAENHAICAESVRSNIVLLQPLYIDLQFNFVK
jgi:hypothetical protein